MPLTEEEKVDLYTRARHKWGMLAQQSMLVEECAELIHTICKLRREGTTDRHTVDQFLEECADVEIMLEQIRLYYGDERIDYHKNAKLYRLTNRVDT